MIRCLLRALPLVGVLALAGCLPTPRVIRETVIVPQTVIAPTTVLVTQPPLPTHTSYPTYTPYPTYTVPPTPTEPQPTATATPTGGHPLSISKNLTMARESGGLVIELRRVVVVDKLYQETRAGARFADSSLDPGSYRQANLVGEFIFLLRNNSGKTLLVYPDQSTVVVQGPAGTRQIDLVWSPINLAGMDNVGGDIRAGAVKVGGFWYPLPKGVTMADVRTLTLRFDGPTDARFATAGPEYVFEVNLSDRPDDPFDDAVTVP